MRTLHVAGKIKAMTMSKLKSNTDMFIQRDTLLKTKEEL